MTINFEERASDCPLVERVWRSQSETAGTFISAASTHWELVVTTYEGKTAITVRGPETVATLAECPQHSTAESEFFGIVFKLGAFMPHLPPGCVMDRQDVVLPGAGGQRFWLYHSAWEMPSYENVDTFLNRLVREDVLVYDPVIDDALQGAVKYMTVRSIQAHFRRATGLTPNLVYQIERAQSAVALLEQGVSIMEIVHTLNYYDQPHLTRSLKRYTGQTPAQIVRLNQPQ